MRRVSGPNAPRRVIRTIEAAYRDVDVCACMRIVWFLGIHSHKWGLPKNARPPSNLERGSVSGERGPDWFWKRNGKVLSTCPNSRMMDSSSAPPTNPRNRPPHTPLHPHILRGLGNREDRFLPESAAEYSNPSHVVQILSTIENAWLLLAPNVATAPT